MLNNKKCLVIGSGISGIGAITLLDHLGARISIFEGNKEITLESLVEKIPKGMKVDCYIGYLPKEIYDEIEVVILSPGVPTDLPLVEVLKEKGAKIIGEIELAYLCEKGRIIGITGTNGKTTTTTLVGEIIKDYYGKDNTFVVGNIGNPYTLEVENTTESSITIGELSSFQLETIDTFKPTVSAILNVTPDHLNRHYTMKAYVNAKKNIFKNQTENDICILNYDNVYTKNLASECLARVIFFSSQKKLEEGYFYEDDIIYYANKGDVLELLNTNNEMNLVGICNVENVMAAIAITRSIGIPIENIKQTIKEFKAVEHRIEFVATKRGIDYYNDSKATNPDAAIQGIKAMKKQTILIGGGYDKDSQFDEWIENFEDKVKWLILIGQTKEKIAECAKKHDFHKIKFAETFEECLNLCVELAEAGEAVLLSPACASWGMFPNYETRGNIFKEFVKKLEE